MPWNDEDLDEGPVPKWHQLAQRLRSAVVKGEFEQGDLLPSETELTRRFGISRTTAGTALRALERDRLVRRRPGHGTVVLPPPIDQPLTLLSSFSEDMRGRGLTAGYRESVVTVAISPPDVAAAFGLAEGDHVVAVDRMLLAEGEPIAHSRCWLAPHAVDPSAPPSAGELDRGSLYAWIERNSGSRVVKADEHIEGATAGAALARRLAVRRGAAVLVARRLSRDTGGRPVELATITYRADRYRYRIELVRP
ncbi:GntR family transcriptional regulator [Saccharomonospora sp. NPDC006951]